MNSRLKFSIVFASTTLVCVLLIGAVIGKSAPADEPYRHLAVFSEVVHRIKSEYVEEPDMKSVTLGAVNGLLESVDPFASFLNAEQVKEYNKKKDSYKGDVGLLLAKRAGYIGVVGTIPGSPAATGGLNVGDWIETIKGVATRDMPLAFAELMLKGEPGTTIEVSVFRGRRPEPQKTTLTRAVIAIPPVQSEILSDQIGYIRPDTLAPGKVKEVSDAIGKLEGQGAKRLVLDLRNCSYGAPEEGVGLANLFVEKGLLTYVQGQKHPRQNYDADPTKVKTRLPLQVVTNRGTANGCEVAAAALSDSKRAASAGERTYGSASVHKTIGLDDGSAVILAVAKFYTPAGKSIPDNGVTPEKLVAEPDSQVELDEDGNPVSNAAPEGQTRVPPKQDKYLLNIVTPDKK